MSDAPMAPGSRGDREPNVLRRAVEECLDRAREQGVEAALDEACARRPDLAHAIRRRVGRLQQAGMLEVDGDQRDGRVPKRLGDYVLGNRLGAGGMGVVYLARQESLGREVAIKIVRPELLFFPGALVRFRREVEAIARLNHRGIASVYAVGEEGGVPYYAMEYIAGATLNQALARLAKRDVGSLRGHDLWRAVCTEAGRDAGDHGPALFQGSWAETCLRIAIEVSGALAHAHTHGIVHRDVKPSNVMLGLDGRVSLLDFGLAATAGDQELTGSGAAVGSVPYMAPEQVRNDRAQVGPWTDVWGLGATLHEMLALEPPFGRLADEGTRTRILSGVSFSLGGRNASVSWDVRTVCATALALDVRHRYASAEAFGQDLAAALAWRPIRAKRPSVWRATLRWARRHPGWAVAVVGTLLGLVGGPLAISIASTRERDAALLARAQAEEQMYFANIAAADLGLRAHDVQRVRHHLARCPPNRRGWEWDHLRTVADASIATLPISPAGMTMAACPDSLRLALREADGIRIVENAGLGPFRKIATGSEWRAFALSQGGRLVYACQPSGEVWVIDVERGTRRQLATVADASRLRMVAATLVASVAHDALVVLDPDSGRVIRQHDFGPGTLAHAFAERRGRGVFALSALNSIEVRDLLTGDTILRRDVGYRASVILSLDGERALACRPSDGLLTLHSVDDGEVLAQRALASSPTLAIAFLDGDRVVIGLKDGAVQILDAKTLEPERTLLGHESSVTEVVRLDRDRFATWSFDRTVRTWWCQGSAARFDLPIKPPGRQVVVMPPLTAIACTADGETVAVGFSDGTITTYAVAEARPQHTFMRQRRRVRALEFDAAGTTLVAWADDCTLVVYGVTDGDVRAEVSLPGVRVADFCIAEDGQRAAGFSLAGSVHVFDLVRGGLIRSVADCGDGPVCAGFAPDGVLWWQDRGGLVRALGPTSSAPELRALLPVGDPVAARIGTSAWNTVSDALGRESTVVAHGGRDVCLASDDQLTRFWSGSIHGDVRVWDPVSAEPVLTLIPRGVPVLDVIVAADGRRVFVATMGGLHVIGGDRPSAEALRARHLQAAADAWLQPRTVAPHTRAELSALLATAGERGEVDGEMQARVRATIAAFGDDDERLCREARAVAMVTHRVASEIERAREFVARVRTRRPEWAAALGVEAILASRKRDSEHAVRSAEHAVANLDDALREPEPEWLAALVAGHSQAGRRQAAEAAMARLEKLMADPRFAQDPQANAYFSSVRRLLELSGSKH